MKQAEAISEFSVILQLQKTINFYKQIPFKQSLRESQRVKFPLFPRVPLQRVFYKNELWLQSLKPPFVQEAVTKGDCILGVVLCSVYCDHFKS